MKRLKIILATANRHKIKEIKKILKDLRGSVRICSLEDIQINFKPRENGRTYKENAIKKAKTLSRLTNLIALADDSGLEINYLGRKPGINSSRFLGKKTSFLKKMKKILSLMKDVPISKRKAKFICSAALVTPKGKVFTSRGVCHGQIDSEIKGKYGFGYDPIFYLPQYKRSMAQLKLNLKNKISHRAKAFGKMRKLLCREYREYRE